MSKKVIRAYCLDWHVGSSNAFIDLLVEPLQKIFKVELTSWDGKNIGSVNSDELVIFCMLPPTKKIMQSYHKIIWIPMWDQAQGYDQQWWNDISKHVNIISFSDAISLRAKKAGLQTLDVRYAVEPDSLKPTSWENGIIISYWNRVGLIGPDYLANLCKMLNAKKLIFRPTIDPRIEKVMYYELPEHIGDCEVTTIRPNSKEEYLAQTADANVLIAPRKAEGVGLVFLEAMARGCAVIAYDAPTMNEYIEDDVTGVLIGNNTGLLRRIHNKFPHSNVSTFLVNEPVPRKLQKINIENIGNNAANTSKKIYNQWLLDSHKLAEFIQQTI